MQTIHKLNTTQKKQITQNTAKQNYPGSLIQQSARKRGGLILQRSQAHTGTFSTYTGLLGSVGPRPSEPCIWTCPQISDDLWASGRCVLWN